MKRHFYFILFIMFFIYGCSSKVPSYSSSSKRYPRGCPATMKSYTVDGKRYYPKAVSVGYVQKGIASWYGPGFHRKKTSNGETYSMYDSTAAHKTLPMNTKVRVTNLKNGKSMVVRINDRGPFVDGRIIDLSKKAAINLGVHANGTAPVKLEVVSVDPKWFAACYSGSSSSVSTYNKSEYKPMPVSKPSTYEYDNSSYNNNYSYTSSDSNNKYEIKNSYPGAESTPVHKDYNEVIVEDDVKVNKTEPIKKPAENNIASSGLYMVQIGSFDNEKGAYAYKDKFKTINGHLVVVKNINGRFKTLVSGFSSREEANNFIANSSFDGAFIVKG